MKDMRSRTADDTRRVFLDIDSLSQWDRGLMQRFPQAEKFAITGVEPGPEDSCDACCANYATVLQEGGRFRMWYCAQPKKQSYAENADHWFICYAESEDGIHWVKPDLGITGQHRYPGNNLLALPGSCQGVVRALPGSQFKYLSVCIQSAPLEPDITDIPGNAYDGGGTFIFGSDDGLHWRQLAKVVCHGDAASLYTDAAAGRYLLYQKAGLIHGLRTRRCIIGLESRDGIHWEGYDGLPYGAHKWRECFMADDYDDVIASQRGFDLADHYGVVVHRVGELYVAVENIFTMGLPIGLRFGQNPGGLGHFRLAFSHNAVNWRRPKGRPAWLELGQPGEFDAGFMVPGMNFLEQGDEVWMYYSGCPFEHGMGLNQDFSLDTNVPLSDYFGLWKIGLIKIKRDRYASLAATYISRFDMDPDAHGSAPLFIHPEHPQLFINACCPHGAIRVALGERGKQDNLPGFSFEDCVPVAGDSVRVPVRFRNRSMADIPPGKAFSLRFEISRGEIFGYEFGPSQSG